MRRTPILAIALSSLLVAGAVLAADPAPAQPGTAKVGFIFATTSAALRESPNAGSKELGRIPSGARLVYRRIVEPGPSWYRVEPPGGAPGWISAKDTSDKRPGAVASSKPIPVEDSGVGLAKSSSSQTAAARGLSKAAVEYAADRKTLKKSADEFVTLEHVVEKQFGDPHDSEGNYPDVDVPGRKEHATTFLEGVK